VQSANHPSAAVVKNNPWNTYLEVFKKFEMVHIHSASIDVHCRKSSNVKSFSKKSYENNKFQVYMYWKKILALFTWTYQPKSVNHSAVFFSHNKSASAAFTASRTGPFCLLVHMHMNFVIFLWIFVDWVWISTFMTMYIYRCTVDVHHFKKKNF
jgi:hypothetical protein